METLFSRHRHTIVLIAALFAQLVLLAWQVKRRDGDVPLLREWVQVVVAPPQKVIGAVRRGVVGLWRSYIDLRGARAESRSLEQELNRERILNQQLRDETQELQRLRALVGFRERSPLTTVATRIIGSGAADNARVLFLSMGRDASLRPNMAVLTPDGIVGKVQRVFRNSAQVLMITDAESGVGCLLENSRVHGVLKGQNAYFCQLRYVLNDEKVEVGDRVFTSGEDRIYPKGLPVGVVTAVRTGPIFKEITVQPAARLNRLEEVLVVIKGVDQELPARPLEVAEAARAGEIEEVGPYPAPIGPAPPPALPKKEAPRAVSNGAYRPGVPRGVRPETDADRVWEAYRHRMAGKTEKTPPAQPPQKKPPAPKPAAELEKKPPVEKPEALPY